MPLLKFLSVVALFLIFCEGVEYAVVRRHSGNSYPPKFGRRLARWIALGIGGFVVFSRFHAPQSQHRDAPLWVGFSYLLLGSIWPRTVFVDSEDISSCSTLGFRGRRIRWDEVSRIDSDWEEVPTYQGFRISGIRVIVLSRSRTQIIHGMVQSHQGQFLADLPAIASRGICTGFVRMAALTQIPKRRPT